MLQHPTQQLETRQLLLFDIHEVAHYAQTLLDPVLQPPAVGLYLPDQLEPVLKAGGSYWYEKQVFLDRVTTAEKVVFDPNLMAQNPSYFTGPVLQTRLTTTPWQYYHYEYVPVTNLEEVQMSPWDIVDSNPNFSTMPKRVVLPHHLAGSVSMRPTLPVQAMQFILQLVNNEVESSRLYRQQPPRSMEEILLPFLRQEYHGVTIERDAFGMIVDTSIHIKNDRWFQDTLSMIWDAMIPVLTPIRTHLRGNPFQMCSIRHYDGYQLCVEQLGDYRIMAWEQITSDPEYQRWLRARANGDWDRYVGTQEEMMVNNNSAYSATSNPYR